MPKLKNPGIVKVFFSSPFGGMEEEREELTRRYFPQIRHLCNSHGLQFAAVDMRWGITSESSANAQVINICLREIDRSDMFIGFFGQRYGWHGADDSVLQDNFNNAVGRYTWLEQFRDKSVTELEFLHGFLNDPGHLPAALFFRDKSFDDKMQEEGKRKGDKKQVFKYSAESELSTKLMDDLKSRVSQQREKSLGVFMNYETPAEAAKTMFEIIMNYLKKTLLVDLETRKLSRREELRNQHDAFLTSRCNIFVNKEKYLKALNNHTSNETDNDYIVVTGEAGTGKSAAICNWIQSLKQDKSTYALAYHFVGFAENSTDVNEILSRLVSEFEYVLYQDEKPRQQEGEEVPEKGSIAETKHFLHKLETLLVKVTTTCKTPVIIIDGLDKVTGVGKVAKTLYWLPKQFPQSCKVVVSTLSSDTQVIEELQSRKYRLIEMEPLLPEAKRDLCVQILQESGKELSPHQLDKIVAAEMTMLPIFLQVTVSELVSFGYFRLLDQKIENLISSKSTEELFGKVLVRLEEDYNVADYPDNVVEQVMCCLYLSRQGLQELEIKEIFSIPDHVWSPLYFAIEKLTINQSGCIKFGFNEFREACSAKYLSDPLKRTMYLKSMIRFFEQEIDKMDWFKENFEEVCPRPVLELPWLWVDLGDMDGLANCLSNFHIFANLQRHNLYDLVLLWRQTGYPGNKITQKLMLTFDKAIARVYTEAEERGTLEDMTVPGIKIDWFLRSIDEFLSGAGFSEDREEVIQRNINILREVVDLPKCQTEKEKIKTALRELKYKLACLFSESYRTAEKGIKLHEELIYVYETHVELHGGNDEILQHIANSYHGLGVAYNFMKQFDKMIANTEKSAEIIQQMENPDVTQFAPTWNSLALGHMGNGNLEEALKYFDRSIQAYEEKHFGETPPVIGEIMHNKAMCYRKLGKTEDAEQMYKKSLEIKEKAFGAEHQIVAIAYLNMGVLEMSRQNCTKAKEYYEKALQIFEALEQTWTNPLYINCWENILQCLTVMLQFEEADKHIMKILKCRLEDNSMDQCLASLYREMLVYYAREGVNYDRALFVAKNIGKHDWKVKCRLEDNSMDQCLASLYREMLVYYVREGVNYDRAFIVAKDYGKHCWKVKCRLEDNSMDQCLVSLYREMLVHYVREEVNYDRAFTVAKALLSTVRKDDLQVYVFLDMAVQNLSEEYRKDVPEEMTVKYIVESNPTRIDILSYYVKTYLVPTEDVDGLASCLNRLHDAHEEIKASTYYLCETWCNSGGPVDLQFQQRSLEEGLKKYPGDLEMCLALAKIHRHQSRADLALPYTIECADREPNNQGLLLFTAETAALASQYDTARHYAKLLLEKSENEEIRTKAQKILDVLDSIEESKNQPPTNSNNDETSTPVTEEQAKEE